MAWNGVGTFLLNPLFSPESNGNVVDAVRYNGLTNDIAQGITACLAKNGENTPTANLPMGGYKHTGAGAATAAGEYAVYEQVALLADLILTTTNKGADLVGYLYNAGYDLDTVGDALDSLFDAIQDLIGTANQITVTQTTATSITLSFPTAVQFPGTVSSAGFTDGVAVPSGQVGEVITTTLSTPAAMTTGTNVNVQTLNLPPGHWEINGTLVFNPDSAYVGAATGGGLSIIPTTLPAEEFRTLLIGSNVALGVIPAAFNLTYPVPPRPLVNSASQIIYLVAQASFSAGSVTVSGLIRARRVR